MQRQYTEKALKALELAKKSAKRLKHSYIGSEHILIGLIEEGSAVGARVLEANGVDEETLLDLIEQLIVPMGNVGLMDKGGFTPRAERILEAAGREAERFKADKIGTEHILIAMIKEADSVATKLLITLEINLQKVYVETLVAMGQDANLYREDFQNGKLVKKKEKGGTPTLNQYSRDLTMLAKEQKLDPVVRRENEIQRMIQILSRRNKNNPCLIGEPGVGKTAIVEGLARRIVAGTVPDTIKDKRVVVLDLAGMVAGSKYRGEFEERIKKVIKEVTNDGNILLFLDEIHTVIGAGGAEGAIDASNILKPSLARGELQIIGATTINEYRKHIEKDPALERRFQPVTVEEPEEAEAIEILKGVRENYEKHHGVIITDEAVEAAVKMSNRYINDRFLPDKAIDLVDEAAAKLKLGFIRENSGTEELEEQLAELEQQEEDAIVMENFDTASEIKAEKEKLEEKIRKLKKKQEKSKKVPTVTEAEIAEIVAMWTKIPVKKIAEEETAKLKRLEKTLHGRVIGQEEAVKAISKAIKRGRVGLKDPNRPIGSFLFLGPTGVGKTELSKALAEAVFGSEDSIIRVDMSEYMEKHSVSKMIGSPPGYVGYEEGGQLSEKIRRNPYSVVLFDEIEKAHPDVFNILLQVLDDGHITDAQGRKVSFKNSIIIMTSNAGAQSIISPKKLGFASEDNEKVNYENMKQNVMEEVKRIFKPEFINRIDEIIVFHALNKEHMKEIVTLLSKKLVARCKEQMDIELTIRDSVKKFIVEKGSDDKYGARPLRRAVQTYIEDAMAEEILNGKIKQGDSVIVGIQGKDIKFSLKEK
ncbi:MAG: ATP-dependent Clp protease ATP-binding subunit [Lachnospiraceae bacterium]|nr:ATP-dependent Clp protease ATP-binding subunit [Lachnospiraceae bacterium]